MAKIVGGDAEEMRNKGTAQEKKQRQLSNARLYISCGCRAANVLRTTSLEHFVQSVDRTSQLTILFRPTFSSFGTTILPRTAPGSEASTVAQQESNICISGVHTLAKLYPLG